MDFNKTQNVLNRMKQAYDKNRGIRISAEELKEMYLTFLGEMWEQPDPRHLTRKSIGQETPNPLPVRYKTAKLPRWTPKIFIAAD